MQRRTFIEQGLIAAAFAGARSRAASAAEPAQPSNAPKIKYAQVGTGHSHAAGKMDAVRRLADLYEVVGYAEADPELAARAARSKTYEGLPRLTEEELLSRADVQVVGIETRMAVSSMWAERAIAAGKHIHLDKPGALLHGNFSRMRREAEKRRLIVQMGYMLRYNPAFELLFRAVRAGALGEILEIDCAMGKLASAAMRHELAEIPGGGMFELACHIIDVAVTLLGTPNRVAAFTKRTRASLFATPTTATASSSLDKELPGDNAADNQLAVLEYDKATATIRCNHADPFGGPRRRFAVAGTKGAMEIVPLESGRCRLMLSEPFEVYKKGDQSFTLNVPPGRYDGEFADLARVVRGEKKLAWDANHDIAVHETVLRAADIWELHKGASSESPFPSIFNYPPASGASTPAPR
jgi:predicted dehydrogenase